MMCDEVIKLDPLSERPENIQVLLDEAFKTINHLAGALGKTLDDGRGWSGSYETAEAEKHLRLAAQALSGITS